jgi:hypothetical protein
MKNTTILILVSVLACVPGLKFSIVPADYVANLGYGFDVTWSEFKKYMDLYTSNVTQDFASAGFTNVRIRMNEKSPNETFMTRLKGQVQDCLNNNIYPILAYQGFEI